MTSETEARRPLRIIVALASVVVIIAGMQAATTLLIPFLLAVFIAVITAPSMTWMQRKGVPTGLAMGVVVFVLVLASVLLGVLIGTSVNDFLRSIPAYERTLNQKLTDLDTFLAGFGVEGAKTLMTDYLDPAAVMSMASRLFTGLGNAFSNAFLILIIVVLMLLEAASFPRKFRAIFGDSEKAVRKIEKIMTNVNTYMMIKSLTSLVTGILVSVWLLILGVDYALLWGVLAFLFNFVPNIGSVIAAIPAILLAILLDGPTTALLVAAGYFVLNMVFGNVIEPRYMGKGLGLSTLVVFISLIFWGWVLGPVGMLLSIPLTMTLKIVLSSIPETQWMGTLLGPAAEETGEER